MTNEEKMKMVDAIVQGETKPRNDYVEYLKTKVQYHLMELDRVLANKTRFARLLEQAVTRETQIRAVLDTYGESIADWQTMEGAANDEGAKDDETIAT